MHTVSFLALLVGSASAVMVTPAGPFDGWNILQDEYLGNDLLDGVSLEWEYFMVHDHGFTGIIGYVLADPRERLGGDALIKAMPSGMNLAIAGKWADGRMVSNFVNFKPDETQVGKDSMTVEARSGDNWCTLVPFPEEGRLLLEGETDGVAFSLFVEQGWPERNGVGLDENGHGPFAPARGEDVGVVPGEHWTVNMIWPRTLVVGSMTDLVGENDYEIDGHGYRENSWGRWTFVTDGWDFAILSDEQSGVQWSWQSYHNSATMDFLDVSFIENGEIKAVQFEGKEGELGWSHSSWSFNDAARQCAPNNAVVEAANDEYYVRAEITIPDQIPLLSDATPVTAVYAIMEWFPTIEGTIMRQDTGEVVASFKGVAGGEISFIKSLFGWVPDSVCKYWGQSNFKQTLKHEVHGSIERDHCSTTRSYTACRRMDGCKYTYSKKCHSA